YAVGGRVSMESFALEAVLVPAALDALPVLRGRPHRRRIAVAVVVRLRLEVEIDGGVDQHPAPLAGAVEVGVAALEPGRRIERGAEGAGEEHDVVLGSIDAIRERPVDGAVVVDVDVVV